MLFIGATVGVLAVILAVVIYAKSAYLTTSTQSAADLAAVAGAHTLQYGTEDSACGVAQQVAEANGSAVESCHIRGDYVLIRVRAEVTGAFPSSREAIAGPSDHPPPAGIATQ